jgi:hypothetical protein
MAIAIIVIVIVVVLLAAAGGIMLLRRRALRRRFGPEYDRLAEKVGERQAVAELSDRQRRMARLDIRPLSPERRTLYEGQWTTLQEQFVDGPARATEAAGALVKAVAADRGYPAGDDGELLTDLSVYHADRLDGYRQARQATAQASTAPTEDLREAMLAYRALLRELLDAPDGASDEAAPEPAAAPEPLPDDADGTRAESAAGPLDDRSTAQATRKD